MAAQAHETSIEEKLEILRKTASYMCRNLIPTVIVPKMNHLLPPDLRRRILERESAGDREYAAKMLIDKILEEGERGMNIFLDVLRAEGADPGWPSILQPLDNVGGINTNEAANHYYVFIIHLLEGQIIDQLDDEDLTLILIELYSSGAFFDYEFDIVEARIRNEGKHTGAVQMFTLLGQRDDQWPVKFFIALRKVNKKLFAKICPYGLDPVVNKESSENRSAPSSMEPEGAASRDADEQTQPKQHLQQTSPERLDTADQLDTAWEPRHSHLPRPVAQEAQGMELSPEETRRQSSQPASSSEDTFNADGASPMEAVADDTEAQGARFSDDEKQDVEESEKSNGGTASRTEAPKDLALRNYQHELTRTALSGANTIVCAPTGSGKTRVALDIVRRHLEEQRPGETRKVVFLARTVPLVSQQHRNFKEFLPQYQCELVTGESENSMNVHLLLDKNQILVLTPKVLENHLTPSKIPTLSRFSLIVFDECHHTRKGEPYNSVMKHYLRSKKRGEPGLPQIVGLTASIGVEKATTAEEVKESILSIMGNLDVTIISQVLENVEELRATVPRPEEDLETLESRENDEISNTITNVMQKILEELRLQEQLVKTDSEVDEIRRLLTKCETDLKSQKFGQWAVTLRNTARLLPSGTPQNLREELKIEARQAFSWKVQVLADWLVAYNEAFDVHDLTRPEDVLHYLERKSKLQRDEGKQFLLMELDMKLLEYFSHVKRQLELFRGQKNPNLVVLGNAINKHIAAAGREDDEEGFRILVFVRTRATCRALCRWLGSKDVDQCLRSLNAQHFTGTGAHQEHGGMTAYEQVETLTRFKQGVVKLLVTTSVGEEGIDIAECNLTIRYNHVGNEVTTVQTRGRSRKRGGRSILMAMPKIIEQEEMNRRREQLMYDALRLIRLMPENVIRQHVNMVQTKVLEVDEIDQIMKQVKQKKTKADFSIACPQCNKVKVDGSQIRCINNAHRVIIGHDINNDVVTYPGKTILKKDDWEMHGAVICRCKNRLGQMLSYKKANFILASPKYWVFLDKNGERSNYKRWNQVPHHIAEVSPADIKKHLGQDDDEDDDDNGEEMLGAVAGV